MQGHLALTGNPTTMAWVHCACGCTLCPWCHVCSIQWSTLNMKMPLVYYGTESGSYKYFKTVSHLHELLHTKATYYLGILCCRLLLLRMTQAWCATVLPVTLAGGSQACFTQLSWKSEQNLQITLILVSFLDGTHCSLTPGQRYYYVYGDYYGWSSEKSFKASPLSKVDVKSTVIAFGGQCDVMWYPQPICHVVAIANCVHLTFSIFNITHADMGCGEEDGSFFLLNNIQPESFNTTHMILQQMGRGNVDFILHLGDLSYARGFSAVVRREWVVLERNL